MKKLLGIIVLGLLWCNVGFASNDPVAGIVPWVYNYTVSGKASDVWVNKNTTYIFTSDSPSTFKNLIFKKEKSVNNVSKKEKYSSSFKRKKLFRSFVFEAEYEDDISVELLIEYQKNKKDFEKAKKTAEYYSQMYGQMPHFLKKYNKKIYIHVNKGKDDGTWWVMMDKREFHINTSRCGSYASKVLYAQCALVMIHELAHVIDQLTGVISPSKWIKAKKLDNKKYCSKYSKKNRKEDFAESVVCWILVREKGYAIKSRDRSKIKKYIPNRLKFLDELKFNMYPLYKF